MADERLLAVLRSGGEAWNRLREEEDLSGLDLTDASLEELDLTGADLTDARLDRAKLFEADLSGAILDGANLWQADLRCARMEGTSCTATKFREADLRAAMLAGCSLREADCREARLKGAEVFEGDLRAVDLSEADLTEAVVSGCRFDGAMFGHTTLAGTRLWDSEGLGRSEHIAPSWLDPSAAATISGDIEHFLRGVGWQDRLIEHWGALTAEGIAFYSCFISYSHADMIFARRLHDALQQEGVRCWLDQHALLPGDDLRDEIDTGIRIWDKILLICSEASLTSWWVDQEIERVLQKEERLFRERGEKVHALIPVRIDDFVFEGWESGKKATVVSRYIGDFRQWDQENDEFKEEFDKLVRALSSDSLARGLRPISKL